MAEYIELEEAVKTAMTLFKPVNTATQEVIESSLRSKFNSLPTADVVQVVHSRWKYFRKQGIAVCMNCSFERELDANFGRAISCPNCGARMDGDNP